MNIEITTVNGATFAITDTEGCPTASIAYSELTSGRGVRVTVGEDEYYIPATGVENIKVRG